MLPCVQSWRRVVSSPTRKSTSPTSMPCLTATMSASTLRSPPLDWRLDGVCSPFGTFGRNLHWSFIGSVTHFDLSIFSVFVPSVRPVVTLHHLKVCVVHSVWIRAFGTTRWRSLHQEWCRLDGPPRTASFSTMYSLSETIMCSFSTSCCSTVRYLGVACMCLCYRRVMGLGTMNTRVRTMAAGSLSGTMLAVNLTLIPAGRRVCSTNTKYTHGHRLVFWNCQSVKREDAMFWMYESFLLELFLFFLFFLNCLLSALWL